MTELKIGNIIMISKEKQFGFLNPINAEADLKKHLYFKTPKYLPNLEKNQIVVFETEIGFKGEFAVRIRYIEGKDIKFLDINSLKKQFPYDSDNVNFYNRHFKEFLIKNKFRSSELWESFKKLKNYLRNEFHDLDVIKLIDKYEVIYEEEKMSRIGKDDYAWTGFRAKNHYYGEDVYLRKLLPDTSKKISSNSGYIPCEKLLDEIRANEIEKAQLNIQAKLIENSIKENAYKNYTKKNHFYALCNHLRLMNRHIFIYPFDKSME